MIPNKLWDETDYKINRYEIMVEPLVLWLINEKIKNHSGKLLIVTFGELGLGSLDYMFQRVWDNIVVILL